MDQANELDEGPDRPREPVDDDQERDDTPQTDELSLEEAGYGYGV
jgi:hypothetical protein